MQPLQKSNAPKRHPLQFPTKSDKAEPKKAIETKVTEQVKIEKEEKIVQKVKESQPQTNIAKVETKESEIKVVEQVKKESANLQEKKVEDAPIKTIQIEQEERKKQENIVQQQVQKEVIKTEILPPSSKEQKPAPIPKPQQKNPEKRQVRDIFSLTSKPKQPLKLPQPSIVPPIVPIKSQLPPKQQEKITQKTLTKEPKPIPPQPQKKQQKIQDHQIIGQKIERTIQKHPVRISIGQTSQKGSGLLKSTYYHIVGEDKHGPFTINRKYEEFQSLNDILHERWPGCFLPALTRESESKKEVERERHIKYTLASYLLGLSYSPHLYYREEVQLFLRSPDVDASEMFKKMPPLKTRDVISRLRSSFGELLDQPVTPAYPVRITSFIATLRKIISSLGTLSLKALSLSEHYDTYSQSLGKFSKIHKSYQQLCLSQYHEASVVARDAGNKLQQLQQLTKHNPFLKLHSFLSNEARDAEAFLQVIIASELFVLRKEDLDRELKELQVEIESLMLGHKSLKVMTTRKPKEEVQAQLEQRHKRLTEERDTMVEMFTILQILLSTTTIAQFQTFKRDNYRNILQQWAQLSQQATPQLEAVWQFVAEQSRTYGIA